MSAIIMTIRAVERGWQRLLTTETILSVSEAWRAHGLADQLFASQEYSVPGVRVLHLVASSACSANDCEYVALAEELGVPLVTADRQLLRAFPDHATRPKDFIASAA